MIKHDNLTPGTVNDYDYNHIVIDVISHETDHIPTVPVMGFTVRVWVFGYGTGTCTGSDYLCSITFVQNAKIYCLINS